MKALIHRVTNLLALLCPYAPLIALALTVRACQ